MAGELFLFRIKIWMQLFNLLNRSCSIEQITWNLCKLCIKPLLVHSWQLSNVHIFIINICTCLNMLVFYCIKQM